MEKNSAMLIQQDFMNILGHIRRTKQQTYAHINYSLLDLYWLTGCTISERVSNAQWGKRVVSELAEFIAENEPTLKGFSDKNLWRMKQFYETYQGNEKLATLWRELSWSHNRMIMTLKQPEEREFYLQLTIKERYSVRELERQIDSALFERTLLANHKLPDVLKASHPSVENTFRDSYVLEFLPLPLVHTEKDLQKALIANMKQFILEVGRDFIFVGEEYRLQVGNSDFFIDLLFFHRGLAALVAFELKIEKFKPEHLGQINFYLEALDPSLYTQISPPPTH
ncbi:MAG: hypothetical protein BWK73_16440 [Thiothrix lacustris]|uniref:NHR domain-containing protein n=1 Tax=Thiothrix lacustris TaxID=525917 RepID=A0A1Y1QRF2_9GAMM|nr:MAG: hypothetical protein BWK73_16440 [Thiothrix lacustris]